MAIAERRAMFDREHAELSIRRPASTCTNQSASRRPIDRANFIASTTIPSGTARKAQRVAALGMDAATRVATPGHGTVWLARSPQRRSPPA